jgi:hypothetical protein
MRQRSYQRQFAGVLDILLQSANDRDKGGRNPSTIVHGRLAQRCTSYDESPANRPRVRRVLHAAVLECQNLFWLRLPQILHKVKSTERFCFLFIAREMIGTLNKQGLKAGVPGLKILPPDRLTELGESVLARSIALYHQRLTEGTAPLSSFNSTI